MAAAARSAAAAAAAAEEEEEGGGRGRRVASEYDEQRLARIKENRARLEALGIPSLAYSFLPPPSKRRPPGEEGEDSGKSEAKKKRVDGDVDEDYQPSDDGGDEELDGDASSSSEEEEEDYEPSSFRRTPKSKGKKKDSSNVAKVRRSLYMKAKVKETDITNDDTALKQAIALSLGGDTENPAAVSIEISQGAGANVTDAGRNRKINRCSIPDTHAKRKIKGNVSRVQLTEDEVVAYFFSFDEAGKGQITLRDLRRMAVAYDFCWTDIEMANMIYCFDSNGDGKLSLDDFQNIVTRCKMMQKS